MLPTDVALLADKKMVAWVELYANDKERWEKDFATAFTKLQELKPVDLNSSVAKYNLSGDNHKKIQTDL